MSVKNRGPRIHGGTDPSLRRTGAGERPSTGVASPDTPTAGVTTGTSEDPRVIPATTGERIQGLVRYPIDRHPSSQNTVCGPLLLTSIFKSRPYFFPDYLGFRQSCPTEKWVLHLLDKLNRFFQKVTRFIVGRTEDDEGITISLIRRKRWSIRLLLLNSRRQIY